MSLKDPKQIKDQYEKNVIEPLLGKGKVSRELIKGLDSILNEGIEFEIPEQFKKPIDFHLVENGNCRGFASKDTIIKNVNKVIKKSQIHTYADLADALIRFGCFDYGSLYSIIEQDFKRSHCNEAAYHFAGHLYEIGFMTDVEFAKKVYLSRRKLLTTPLKELFGDEKLKEKFSDSDNLLKFGAQLERNRDTIKYLLGTIIIDGLKLPEKERNEAALTILKLFPKYEQLTEDYEREEFKPFDAPLHLYFK